MRGLAVLACLTVLLAGCSGGDGGDSPSGPSGSMTSTSTGPAPPPVPTTDTLHFLEGPMMTALPPTGSDVRTPVGFSDGGPDGNQRPGATWSHVVTVATNVTGAEVHVWVEVLEQMLEAPTLPPATQCTWQLTTAIGGDTVPITSCINEPPGPISPGVKELVFSLVLQGNVEFEVGETITVGLARNAFSASANNAVDALSGSIEHDSRITLRGLKEPLVA